MTFFHTSAPHLNAEISNISQFWGFSSIYWAGGCVKNDIYFIFSFWQHNITKYLTADVKIMRLCYLKVLKKLKNKKILKSKNFFAYPQLKFSENHASLSYLATSKVRKINFFSIFFYNFFIWPITFLTNLVWRSCDVYTYPGTSFC